MKVFNPNTKRYDNQDISKTYKINERKTLYNKRIIEVEHYFTGNVIYQCFESRMQEVLLVLSWND